MTVSRPMPEFHSIAVEKLLSPNDEEMQERLVDRIADDFHWAAFGALTVGRRPSGDLVVIDGRHRLAAVRALGIEEVPCTVSAVSSVEEEEEIRRLANTYEPLTEHEAARAKFTALDTESAPKN